MNSVVKHSKFQCAIEWFLTEDIFPGKKTLSIKYCEKHAAKISGYGSNFFPMGVISTGEVLFP